MNKYLLFPLCAFISLFVNAQDNSKYLAGAVPEVDGKVVFSESIKVNNPISEETLFEAMHKWAKDNYENVSKEGLTNRVLLVDGENKDIACYGEKYLVFKSSALVLDRSKMMYQLIISVDKDKCDLKIRNIRYEYSDSKTPIPAEEQISDKMALNKNKDKLNRYYDKFRIHTVDTINTIFENIDIYLNGRIKGGIAVQNPLPPAVASKETVETVTTEMTIPGFKKVDSDKIPRSIQGNEALILSGTVNQPLVITSSWGGVTTLMDKQVALSTVDTAQDSGKTVGTNQTYTISFYTEMYADALKEIEKAGGDRSDKIKAAGFTPVATPLGAPAFSEAWLIIECKKSGVMPSSEANSESYIGEILNVWVK